MTESEVIDAAREAGLQLNLYAEAYPLINQQLIRFAAIICAKQREKDARICEEESSHYGGRHDYDAGGEVASSRCAEAIRGQE